MKKSLLGKKRHFNVESLSAKLPMKDNLSIFLVRNGSQLYKNTGHLKEGAVPPTVYSGLDLASSNYDKASLFNSISIQLTQRAHLPYHRVCQLETERYGCK